jgi:hypothetical protein
LIINDISLQVERPEIIKKLKDERELEKIKKSEITNITQENKLIERTEKESQAFQKANKIKNQILSKRIVFKKFFR